MPEVTELRVALTVAELDDALALYRDALGLQQIAAGAPTRTRRAFEEPGAMGAAGSALDQIATVQADSRPLALNHR
jgi:catechol 2,3-dioxygenase-like lactoylglutathione lyase family enzyme